MKYSPFFLVGLLLIAGCTGAPKNPNLATPTEKRKTTPERTTAANLPPEYNTQALRALGYPFEKPVAYKVVGLPDPMTGKAGPTKIGGREVKVTGPSDGKLQIEVTWTGELSSLNKDTYTAAKSGVTAVLAQGNELKPPTLYLPANLARGVTWSGKFSFSPPGSSQKLNVDSSSRVAGKETISVPLGKFETTVVSETWNITSGDIRLVQTGRTWYADGYGMVRTEIEVTKTQKGTKPANLTLSFVAIPPKGKKL